MRQTSRGGTVNSKKVEFVGSRGETLAARFDLPLAGKPRAYAIFAHCFTCSKDVLAASRISSGLANEGVATLRFDFTGLGHSDGEFANTNFSSNVDDLLAAADFLRGSFQAPRLLVGHSLGGTAVLLAAAHIPEVRGLATIGAPASPIHVKKLFSSDLDAIEKTGSANVIIAGRQFTIRKQFLEDLEAQDLSTSLGNLDSALLVLHSPTDATVDIENAAMIFQSAKHPKSFVSLDHADHLITQRADAEYAAEMIASWSKRYLPTEDEEKHEDPSAIRLRESGLSKFAQDVQAGRHCLYADEPPSVGGKDLGPAPHDFVAIGLGACTAMTLRLYAEHKDIEVGTIGVDVEHGKLEGESTASKAATERRHHVFKLTIRVDGELDQDRRAKLLEIANKCPVHRTLDGPVRIETTIIE